MTLVNPSVLLLWQSYEDLDGVTGRGLERRPNAESWIAAASQCGILAWSGVPMQNLGLTCGFCTSTQAPAEVAVLSPPKVQNPAILDMIIANSRLSHNFKPSSTASQRQSSMASATSNPSLKMTPVKPLDAVSLFSRTDLQKSLSSDSNSSISFSQSRLQRSRLEQITQLSRPIMPTLADNVYWSNAAPDHKMIRVNSSDGTLKEITQIPNPPYVQPMHPKSYCQYCDDHKEGFRGEQELRRHIDRAHKNTRKVWVCVDISPDKKFLANCKACRNKKTYGAYYNAAAHLRRAHFNPCKRGRGGRGKGDEKREGKGGGLFPSMETLKEWMYEMVETVPVNSSPLVDDEMLGELDEDSYYPTPLTLQASSSNMSNGLFDETLAFTHPPVSAPYSTYEVLNLPKRSHSSVARAENAEARTVVACPRKGYSWTEINNIGDDALEKHPLEHHKINEQSSAYKAYYQSPERGNQELDSPNLLSRDRTALEDYEMQLMLLEQQNKKPLEMARRERETMISTEDSGRARSEEDNEKSATQTSSQNTDDLPKTCAWESFPPEMLDLFGDFDFDTLLK